MGISSDATLCYGVEIGGADDGMEGTFDKVLEDFDNSFYDYFEDLVRTAGGVTGTWGTNPKYYEQLRAAEANFPIELVTHCHGEYPMSILAIRGSVQTANRGYPINPSMEIPPQDKIDFLVKFCKDHGLEVTPSWILCSYIG